MLLGWKLSCSKNDCATIIERKAKTNLERFEMPTLNKIKDQSLKRNPGPGHDKVDGNKQVLRMLVSVLHLAFTK